MNSPRISSARHLYTLVNVDDRGRGRREERSGSERGEEGRKGGREEGRKRKGREAIPFVHLISINSMNLVLGTSSERHS